MNHNPMFHLLRLTLTYICVCMFLTGNSNAQTTALARDCYGNVSAIECQEDECRCNRWIVEWRYNGKVWGMIEGATRDEVTRKRDADIKFEERYAKFFGRSFDEKYRNPSEPLCERCAPKFAITVSAEGRTALNNARQLVDEWEIKLRSAAAKLTTATEHSNLSRDTGGVLRDYARALSDAQSKLKELKRELITLRNKAKTFVLSDLNFISNDFQRMSSQVERTYNVLPQAVKNSLEGRPTAQPQRTQTRSSARWSAEIILGTGSKLVQKVEINAQVLNEHHYIYGRNNVLDSETTSTVNLSDLDPSNIIVRQLGDDYLVIISTKGERRVIETRSLYFYTDGRNDARSTLYEDIIGIYFNNRSDADRAAQDLKNMIVAASAR